MHLKELYESLETKEVTVQPSATQLSKGAKALDDCVELQTNLMSKLSAKEKRAICASVYKVMVGNPQTPSKETK